MTRSGGTPRIPAIVVVRTRRMKPVVVVIVVRAGSRGLDHPATAGQPPLAPGTRVQFLVGTGRNRLGILAHREGLAHLPALAARLARGAGTALRPFPDVGELPVAIIAADLPGTPADGDIIRPVHEGGPLDGQGGPGSFFLPAALAPVGRPHQGTVNVPRFGFINRYVEWGLQGGLAYGIPVAAGHDLRFGTAILDDPDLVRSTGNNHLFLGPADLDDPDPVHAETGTGINEDAGAGRKTGSRIGITAGIKRNLPGAFENTGGNLDRAGRH